MVESRVPVFLYDYSINTSAKDDKDAIYIYGYMKKKKIVISVSGYEIYIDVAINSDIFGVIGDIHTCYAKS
jgi:hypothetical protein